MKPSELPESGWIKIAADGGAIGFHRHYGILHCFAMDENGEADDVSKGMLILSDETEVPVDSEGELGVDEPMVDIPAMIDAIYEQWADGENATVTRSY